VFAVSSYSPIHRKGHPTCECGGNFSHLALYRCPHCNSEMTIDQIKPQINWWGSPNGIPGIFIVGAKWYGDDNYISVIKSNT
jgi:hypothetical protein